MTRNLTKLEQAEGASLAAATPELLEDAAGLGSYINQRAPEVVDFKVALAIVQEIVAEMRLPETWGDHVIEGQITVRATLDADIVEKALELIRFWQMGQDALAAYKASRPGGAA